jgi:lipopolysaccharide export LptBFGC system permease protein LptF
MLRTEGAEPHVADDEHDIEILREVCTVFLIFLLGFLLLRGSQGIDFVHGIIGDSSPPPALFVLFPYHLIPGQI